MHNKIIDANGTARVLKETILIMLQDDLGKLKYRPKVDGSKFEIRVSQTADNIIELKAMNLTKRVIPENLLGIGFFETLDYSIVIKPDQSLNERVEINFKIRGKYGSGWFAPRSSRYKPMAPLYQAYLNAYAEVFKIQLIDALQK